MTSTRQPEGERPRALVTGVTGFIGGALTRRLLDDGWEVAGLVRKELPADLAGRVRPVRGDLADPASLLAAAAGCSVVFHVAARVGVWGPVEGFRVQNVDATDALLAAARAAGAKRFVFCSSPSVVYSGRPLAGVDESLPLTDATLCPSPYPVTKAEAERRVRKANGADLRTVALRPHLVWGPGDRHLVPRVLARADAGRLRVVGEGRNRVDLTHVDNVVDAFLAAAAALEGEAPVAGGRAYFITNGEPVVLWDFVNRLLEVHGRPPVRRRVPLSVAYAAGAVCETAWRILRRAEEPPMTRFIAAELASDHWFDIGAARRDLAWEPRVSMEAGLERLAAALKGGAPA